MIASLLCRRMETSGAGAPPGSIASPHKRSRLSAQIRAGAPQGTPMATPLDRNVERLTQQSIPRSLLTLSSPIVLANLLVMSLQLVNTFWLGQVGARAVAAASAAFPMVFLLLSVGNGFSAAGSILVSHHAGARDQRMVNHITTQTLLMITTLALALAVVGYIVAPALLRGMGIGPDVIEDAQIYLRISFLGAPFSFVFALFQAILRSVGEIRAPLYLAAISTAANLILAPLLIFGWGEVPALGVAGAACATLLAQGLATVFGLHLLFSGRVGVHIRRADLPPDPAVIKRVLLLGTPACLEQSMQALGIAALTALVAGFGTVAVAAYGIGYRLFVSMLIPAYGISMATMTLVGHNFGAGDPQRARAVALACSRISFYLLCGIGVLVIAGANPLLRLLAPHDPELQALGADAVRIMVLAFAPLGIQMGLVGALRGAGDTVLPMTLSFVGTWFVQLPLAWIISKHTFLGVAGLWWCYPLNNLLLTTILVLRFRYGRWHNSSLTAIRRRPRADAMAAANDEAGY